MHNLSKDKKLGKIKRKKRIDDGRVQPSDDTESKVKMTPSKGDKYKISKYNNFEESILMSIFVDKIKKQEELIEQEQRLQLVEGLIDTLEANTPRLVQIMDDEDHAQHEKVLTYLFDVCEALWAYQDDYTVAGVNTTRLEKATGFNIDNWTSQFFAKPPHVVVADDLAPDAREIYDQIVNQYEEQ